eukprot:SAG11_NODE_27733_length_329_cov_1.852174_1_plen_60_part_10
MLIRHSLMQSATPLQVGRYRGKFSCTIVGTGRKYAPVLFPYIAGKLGPGSAVSPETIAGG